LKIETCKHTALSSETSEANQHCSPFPIEFDKRQQLSKQTLKHRQNTPKILEAHTNVWARKHAYGTLQNFQLYPKSRSFCAASHQFMAGTGSKYAYLMWHKIKVEAF